MVDVSDALNAFRKLGTAGLDKISKTVLTIGGTSLLRHTRAAISFRDHPYSQLQAMGHPYARRQGTPGIHGGAPVVHTRSGRMLSALQGKMEGKRTYRYGFDEARAPHARFVILGTKVMLPRDVFRGIYNDKDKSRSVIKLMKLELFARVRELNGRRS